MKQAIVLSVMLAAAFVAAQEALGFGVAAALGFGFVMVISMVNALTFMWLWWARATPLALGMTFSWAGQALLTVWFFVQMAPYSQWREEANLMLFLFLSLYVVGGALHIAVMQRSMELSRAALVAPVVGALVLATVTAVLL